MSIVKNQKAPNNGITKKASAVSYNKIRYLHTGKVILQQGTLTITAGEHKTQN